MRVLRRLSSLGRLFVALALLGGIWLYSVYEVDQDADRAERLREDRRAVSQAEGYAGAIGPWFTVGKSTAVELGNRLRDAPGDTAKRNVLSAHFAARRDFGREVLVVGTDNRAILSVGQSIRDRAAFTPCNADREFSAIVTEGRRGATAPRRLHAPQSGCQPRLAIAAPAGGDVVVLLAAVEDAPVRLQAGNERYDLFAPGELPAPTVEATAVPDELRAVHEARTSETGTSRFDRGDARRIGAYAEVAEGWSMFLEQDAGTIDEVPAAERPAYIVGRTLAFAFVAVFLLLALFDIRRRRAHERSEDAKRAFFATVGHELRTPLTVLKGYSETLASRWDALDDSSRKMLIENMVPQTRRLGNIVEKLLFASNIQAEAYMKPKAADVDVIARLRKVANDFAPMAPLHRFDVDGDADLPDARADVQALDLVLRELVDNAVKYSPSGGTVHLDARRTRRGVEIVVTDEGVGLPTNERKIFEPLVQGESVDTRVHDEGGAGVGLYIVRTLVRDMGGSVRAERAKPSGSRFIVTLRPARASRAAAPVGG